MILSLHVSCEIEFILFQLSCQKQQQVMTKLPLIIRACSRHAAALPRLFSLNETIKSQTSFGRESYLLHDHIHA